METPEVHVTTLSNLASEYPSEINTEHLSSLYMSTVLKRIFYREVPRIEFYNSIGDTGFFLISSAYELFSAEVNTFSNIYIDLQTMQIKTQQHTVLHVPLYALTIREMGEDYLKSVAQRLSSEEYDNHCKEFKKVSEYIHNMPVIITNTPIKSII